MSTGYIVWDSRGRRIIAGPYATSAEATKAIARIKVDGAETAKTSKTTSGGFTVESVTLA